MSVINANPLMLGDAGYNIGRSLRFRSSASAYLSRTPASNGDQKTFTWSGWVKRGTLGAANSIYDASYGNNTRYTIFYFTSTDTLRFFGGIYTTGASTTTSVDLVTTQVFRDPSAWYHIILSVDTTQATASNRVKIYVNGTQITAFGTSTYPAQNAQTYYNVTTTANVIGADSSQGFTLDGYLAEVNFIDGQALTPSSFGQTEAVTGVWTPKKYTGTYGTNGFYLPFSDNTSATTLAYDKSGNGNNWTANNISTTAGATYDSMTDVPTLTSATAANYCVLNPVTGFTNNTITNGNLTHQSATAIQWPYSTFSMPTGKWYWEMTATTLSGSYPCAGMWRSTQPYAGAYLGANAAGIGYFPNDGKVYTNGVGTAVLGTFAQGDLIGCAFDADSGKFYVAKNGTWLGSADPSAGTNPALSGLTQGDWSPSTSNNATGATRSDMNFGQRPFSYTPPTGFKALNTFNLHDPTIKKPNQYMDATTYTGTGVNGRSVANSGAMQPDLVWIKARNAAYYHVLFDSVRGTNKQLSSNATDAETTSSVYGYVSSFNADGFSVWGGSTDDVNVNDTANTYVGWQWKKGATPGFDIVTYTGTGVARTVSHSLGVAPKMIIVKNRASGTSAWMVYHGSLTSAAYYLALNTTAAQASDATAWNSTAPTSSVFSLGANIYTNGNSQSHVAYLFAEIAGFSKFGSYTGNGSADGPFVFTNFQPKYVMIKRTDAAGNSWNIFDVARNTYNLTNLNLYANLSDVDGASTTHCVDLISNGFKIRGSGTNINASGGTYIFAAFAENPFKYSNAR